MATNTLENRELARFIRFVPRRWTNWPCLKVQLYGHQGNIDSQRVSLANCSEDIRFCSVVFIFVCILLICNKNPENRVNFVHNSPVKLLRFFLMF